MSRTKISTTKRFRVFERDGFTCQYCGAKAPQNQLQIDHVVPLCDGGTNDVSNLITACWACNNGKRDNNLKESTLRVIQLKRIQKLIANHIDDYLDISLFFAVDRIVSELGYGGALQAIKEEIDGKSFTSLNQVKSTLAKVEDKMGGVGA